MSCISDFFTIKFMGFNSESTCSNGHGEVAAFLAEHQAKKKCEERKSFFFPIFGASTMIVCTL